MIDWMVAELFWVGMVGMMLGVMLSVICLIKWPSRFIPMEKGLMAVGMQVGGAWWIAGMGLTTHFFNDFSLAWILVLAGMGEVFSIICGVGTGLRLFAPSTEERWWGRLEDWVMRKEAQFKRWGMIFKKMMV